MYGSDGRRIFDYQLELRGGIESFVIAATMQLEDDSAQFLRIDGGVADREVRAPASNRDGVFFRAVNVGATNALLLRDSTGAPIAGVTTALAPSEATWLVCEGGTWRHTGIETVVL